MDALRATCGECGWLTGPLSTENPECSTWHAPPVGNEASTDVVIPIMDHADEFARDVLAEVLDQHSDASRDRLVLHEWVAKKLRKHTHEVRVAARHEWQQHRILARVLYVLWYVMGVLSGAGLTWGLIHVR